MSNLAAARAFIALALLKVACGLAAFVLPEHQAYLFPAWIGAAQMLAYAAASALLVAGTRRDARATNLAAYFLGFASMFADHPLARVAQLGPSALASAASWLIAFRPDAAAAAFLWLFAARFPDAGVSAAPRWASQIAFRIAAAGGAIIIAANLWLRLVEQTGGSAPRVIHALGHSGLDGMYWTALIFLTLPAFAMMLWRAHRVSAGERRRVRLFVVAFVCGSAPMSIDVLLEALIPAYGRFMSQPLPRHLSGLVLYSLTLSIPFTTTYAVLVDRVLDVRLAIRTALRYALVKYAALALFVAPFAATLLYLYAYRDLTLSGFASARHLPIILLVLILAAAGVRYGSRLFEAIDRRFFREHYDGRRVLVDLIARSRTASSVAELTDLLTAGVDRALHVSHAALLTVDDTSQALVGAAPGMPPLENGSPLSVLIGGSAEPLLVNARDVALRRLPQKDREWLERTGFHVLVPLLSSDSRLIGLLGVGEKRSELPFSEEDLQLLSDAGGSSGLALENLLMRTLLTPSAARSPSSPLPAATLVNAAFECKTCGLIAGSFAAACQSCGGALAQAPVPQVLLGKFRFEARIGSGGMGVVYRAVDLALGRTVAVKTLPQLSPDHAQRLRREARAMASLSHPHLALIYGAEMWRGTPMLMFEYLDGGTLADRLRARAQSPRDVVLLGVRLADALAHMHRSGVLHRDIKPSNIGYRLDGTPKLLDFGLAKIVAGEGRVVLPAAATALTPEQETTTGMLDPLAMDGGGSTGSLQVLGTPMYLSPEVVRGLPPDPSSDLWALAITLYQAICLRNPLASPTLLETLDRIARTSVVDIRTFAPDCPAPLAAFFQRALDSDITRRPPDAHAFKAALEALSIS